MKERKPETAKTVTHTPGPWFAEEGDNDVRDRSGELIACAYGFFNADDQVETTPTTFANARLIAAAPGLLKELEHAHDMIRHYLRWGYLPHMSAEEAECFMSNSSSVIRKAKGDHQ